jgi:hypothetical protein
MQRNRGGATSPNESRSTARQFGVALTPSSAPRLMVAAATSSGRDGRHRGVRECSRMFAEGGYSLRRAGSIGKNGASGVPTESRGRQGRITKVALFGRVGAEIEQRPGGGGPVGPELLPKLLPT